MSLMSYVVENTLKYIQTMPKERRKLIGQFFTSAETAQFMAEMFSKPKKEFLSILDPGAGSGILSAAVIQRLQEEDSVKKIKLTCYETNDNILPILKANLQHLKEKSRKLI